MVSLLKAIFVSLLLSINKHSTPLETFDTSRECLLCRGRKRHVAGPIGSWIFRFVWAHSSIVLALNVFVLSTFNGWCQLVSKFLRGLISNKNLVLCWRKLRSNDHGSWKWLSRYVTMDFNKRWLISGSRAQRDRHPSIINESNGRPLSALTRYCGLEIAMTQRNSLTPTESLWAYRTPLTFKNSCMASSATKQRGIDWKRNTHLPFCDATGCIHCTLIQVLDLVRLVLFVYF